MVASCVKSAVKSRNSFSVQEIFKSTFMHLSFVLNQPEKILNYSFRDLLKICR